MVGVASTCTEARGRDCCFLLVSSVALFLPRAQELLTLVFLCLLPGEPENPLLKKKNHNPFLSSESQQARIYNHRVDDKWASVCSSVTQV